MYLKLEDGSQIKVGKKSVFEIVTKNRETELRVSPTGRGDFRHISWHYGRPTAEKSLLEIETAIRRGEKFFKV